MNSDRDIDLRTAAVSDTQRQYHILEQAICELHTSYQGLLALQETFRNSQVDPGSDHLLMTQGLSF